MNSPVAFCPKCHNEVAFIESGSTRRCPICGASYSTGSPPNENFVPAAVSTLGLILRFVLILALVAVVGIGVLFVGCVISLKGL